MRSELRLIKRDDRCGTGHVSGVQCMLAYGRKGADTKKLAGRKREGKTNIVDVLVLLLNFPWRH
jgi:hypothetical protein